MHKLTGDVEELRDGASQRGNAASADTAAGQQQLAELMARMAALDEELRTLAGSAKGAPVQCVQAL